MTDVTAPVPPALFQPLQLGALQLDNRIVIAPMCLYSAHHGNAQNWHFVHYGTLAASGAGMLILEATAVSAYGRISANDLGLYSDENQTAFAALLTSLKHISSMPVAVQLSHAGRKASRQVPWQGAANIGPDLPLGWQTVAPSALAFAPADAAPQALTDVQINEVVQDFARAAQRADEAGIDGIELHMAHGYLLHQFLSPLSNQRSDAYGGSLENRLRFALEVFAAVRQAVRADKPVWVRISATDWVPGGWALEDSLVLSQRLKALGAAAIHVSSGGLSMEQRIPAQVGYQVGFATAIKEQVGLPSIAVGLITEAAQAQAIIASGQADAIAIGRAALYDPRWPWHAAAVLGAQVQAPASYWRCLPHGAQPLFKA